MGKELPKRTEKKVNHKEFKEDEAEIKIKSKGKGKANASVPSETTNRPDVNSFA